MIEELLKNKTGKEKANIKGVEIAKWKEFVFIMTQAPKEVAAST